MLSQAELMALMKSQSIAKNWFNRSLWRLATGCLNSNGSPLSLSEYTCMRIAYSFRQFDCFLEVSPNILWCVSVRTERYWNIVPVQYSQELFARIDFLAGSP